MPSREVKKNGQSVDKKAESDRAKAYVSNGYAVQNHESDHFLFQKPFCENKKKNTTKKVQVYSGSQDVPVLHWDVSLHLWVCVKFA